LWAWLAAGAQALEEKWPYGFTMKVRILFTTPVLHHPPVGGPTLRIENSIKALSQISDLYVYSRVSLNALGGQTALSFYKQFCKDFYFAPSVQTLNRYEKFTKKAVNFLFKKFANSTLFKSNVINDLDQLLRIANSIKPDFIWLGYGNISYPVLEYIKEHNAYKVVIDTDSVWSRFIFRGLPYVENDEERKKITEDGNEKKEEESRGTKLADVTTAVSDVDAEYYRSLSKDPSRVHIFSNVIDMAVYKRVPLPPESFQKPCMYLAGSFWPKSPMDDSARWVINQILPLVRKQVPDIHLYIIGNKSDQILSDIDDPRVTVTGQLPSVLPYLCHADVALVPLRFESGTRFKILEAGACRVPVVSTTLGAEGLPITHEKNILIADTPEKFASSVVRLIKDRDFAFGLAKNLRSLVQEKNSISALVQEGIMILEYLSSLNKSV
jgi:glycosyltransferase involved in cell wall biosynthesis